MRRMAIVLLVGLAACRRAPPPQEAVLTFVPTGMRAAGAVAPASNDPNTACLIAGGSIETTIAVARSPVTVIVIAFTPTPTTVPSFELRVGAKLIAADVVSTLSSRIMAYNVSPVRGEHMVRVSVPGLSPGVLCVQSVAITQR